MAKPLVLEYNGAPLSFDLKKITRESLYGYRTVEAVDDDQRKCDIATLADDGRTLIGRGGTGVGYLTADKKWSDRKSLQPVDLEGNEIKPVSSSFNASIPLTEKTTPDDYFEHNIRSVYHLTTESDAAELLEELRAGVIYKFPFSYRGGIEPDAAFLIVGVDGNPFLALGQATAVDYVGLQQAAGTVEEEETAEDDDGDLMDFGMI